MDGNDPPSLGYGVAGEIRMSNAESVQSVTSVVPPILRVYWSPFVGSSSLSGICGTKFSKIFRIF